MSMDIFDPEKDFASGWESRPEMVKEIALLQPIGAFEDTPAGQAEEPLPEFVNQDASAIKVTGKPLPVRHQGRSPTCVSLAVAAAVEYALLSAIANGAPFEFPEFGIATEPIYGGSRVEVGKSYFGRQGGSLVAWGVEFVKRWGICKRAKYPVADLTEYSEPISADWGIRGVPDSFEPTLRQFPVQGVAEITTLEGYKKAVAQGYGVAFGSSYWLADRRDANGFINFISRTGHAMCGYGYGTFNRKLYVPVRNSWGSNAHTGPVNPLFPSVGGGLVPGDQFETMIKSRRSEVWAVSNVVGFPKRDYLNWYI